MYRVTMLNGTDETVISAPDTSSLRLSSGIIKRKLNAIDSFTFTINPDNPAWGNIYPMRTIITVKDIRSGTTEFRGRAVNPRGSMSEDGRFIQTIECEGLIAYLHDSIQRHAELHNVTVRNFFESMLYVHNAFTDSSKKILPGTCNVTSSTGNLYRYLSYDSTWDSIKDKLVDRLGGYLFLRNESAPFYLDYLTESGVEREMGIDLTKNLLAIEKRWQVNELITKLIPLGAEIESVELAVGKLEAAGVIANAEYWLNVYGDLPFLGELLINLSKFTYKEAGGIGNVATVQEAITFLAAAGAINSPGYWLEIYEAEAFNNLGYLLYQAGNRLDTEASTSRLADASKPRLTIADVNNGKDYLIDSKLVEQYGIIEGIVKWDDVTVPGNLKIKGEEWLAAQTGVESITLTALRLHLLNENYEDFKLGNYYKPNNKVLGIGDNYYQMTEQSIDVSEPQKSDLTLGNRPLSLSGYASFAGGKG